MKQKTSKKILFFLAALMLAAAAAAAETEKLTAAEWPALTRQRKIYFVLGSMEALQKKGVLFRHTMDDYIEWLEAEAGTRPSADMDEVFGGLVAAKERPAR